MQVSFEIPQSIADELKSHFGHDLSRAALEALVIEGYRMAHLSAGEVANVLGFATSIEARDWLGHRGIELNYSLADLEADRASLAKFFPEMA
jgi:hypothetical protein